MHDRNKTPLKVGDEVLIPARITRLDPGEDFCNVALETLDKRRPDGKTDIIAALNTGTVTLFRRGDG